jgi:hypothetical protein
MYVRTFVTLECVRARVWLSPSLRSVAACVWPWLPERSSLHIYVNMCMCMYRVVLEWPSAPKIRPKAATSA